MAEQGQPGGLMARPRGERVLRETIEAIVVTLVVALALRTWVVEPFLVDGTSMRNTLQNNERLLVDKLWWLFGPLHYGQIIVFVPPIPGASEDYVKRVIATGGQTVSMSDGQVYVNGRKMPQAFLRHGRVSTEDNWTMGAERVPKGDLFVLGDNRANSEDSRYFGFVPESSVQGVVFWAFWPAGAFGPIH